MKISKQAEYLLWRLNHAGYCAYLVGGCVRDLFIGKEPMDWDITTNATPQQVIEVFSDLNTVPTGFAHGTITVILEGEPFEVTTFRQDGSYMDHRRPKSVSFVSDLSQDLSRRDFTMNAIAYHPQEGVVDPFHGQKDIKNRCIRAVGKPKRRFSEDALRILRAFRFSSTLGFSIQDATLQAAYTCAPMISTLAKERVTAEFVKLLNGKDAEPVLRNARYIMQFIFSQALYTEGLSLLPDDLITRLCFVFQQAIQNLNDLRFDRETKQRVQRILNYKEHMCKEVSIRYIVRDLGEDAKRYLDYREACGDFVADMRSELLHIQKEGTCCTMAQLAISGRDLIAIGIPEGQKIGIVLRSLLDKVIQEKVPNKREKLLECAFDIMHTL